MNPYALPSLVLAIVGVLLGVYVLSKDSKSKVNRNFSIAVFFAVAWFAIEFITYFVPHGTVEQLIKVGWICRVFVVAFFLNFTLVFPRERKILTRKWGYLVIFAPAIVISILMFSFMRGIAVFYWGFAPPLTLPVRLYIVYFFVCLLAALYLFIDAFRNPKSNIEKNQVRWLLYGSSIIIIYNLVSAVILQLNVYPGPELNNVLITTAFILFSVGITKYKLFVIPPISRFFIPAPEARLRTKLKYKLKEGRSYLIKEPERGPKIFRNQVMHDVPGLWLTTLHPNKIRERYGLARSSVLYLTPERVAGEAAEPPNRLDKATGVISNYFFARPRKSVVFVDCFKELVVTNGFEKALDFLNKLDKLCYENNSNLIVRIDPSKFTEKQLMVIEKVMTRP